MSIKHQANGYSGWTNQSAGAVPVAHYHLYYKETLHYSPRLLANILIISHGNSRGVNESSYILMIASTFCMACQAKKRCSFMWSHLAHTGGTDRVFYQNICCTHMEVNSFGFKMSYLRKTIYF